MRTKLLKWYQMLRFQAIKTPNYYNNSIHSSLMGSSQPKKCAELSNQVPAIMEWIANSVIYTFKIHNNSNNNNGVHNSKSLIFVETFRKKGPAGLDSIVNLGTTPNRHSTSKINNSSNLANKIHMDLMIPQPHTMLIKGFASIMPKETVNTESNAIFSILK